MGRIPARHKCKGTRRWDHTFPSGFSTHGYDMDGACAPGVTTVLRVLDKPALPWWYGKQTALCAIDDEMWQIMGRDEAVKYLAGAGNRTRDKAALLGTLLHDYADALHKTGEIPPEVDPDVVPFVASLARYIDEWKPETVLSEYAVGHRGIGYMGTADQIIDVPGTGRLLIDLKGLALDTPLPTPTGWTTMGAVQPGDRVLGADGRPCAVTMKSGVHMKPCYRITFDDGSSIVCDEDHRWKVRHTLRYGSSVLTTKALREAELVRVGQHRYVIDNASPLELPDADLPIDPYLLGVWLGDGKRTGAEVCLGQEKRPIADAFRAAGYRVHSYGHDGNEHSISGGFRTLLRTHGLWGHKHVPDVYLRGSTAQRLALLQGLMDTDGSWHKTRRQAVFTSTDKALSAGVYELVVSLGWRASANSHQSSGFGVVTTAHTVSFVPRGMNPFRLVVHKAAGPAARPEGTTKSGRRLVRSVEPTVLVPTQCVMVDSQDHTYLCGEQMVPTHNTGGDAPGKVYPEFGLQLAALRYGEFRLTAFEGGKEEPIIPVDGCAIVHVRPDFYEVVPYEVTPADLDAFAAVKAVHDWRQSHTDVLAAYPHPSEPTLLDQLERSLA